MKRLRGRIKITLLSDFCPNSGYAYAGLIDQDVCFDETGLPYIPAKRLKGCFRETLEGILFAKYPDSSVGFFGKRGDRNPGSLYIGNAHIDNHEAIQSAIIHKRKNSENKALYETNRILDRFSRVSAQTQLDNGTAKKGSLRFSRVINQKSPFGDNENLAFFADVAFLDKDQSMLCDILTATRHIGLKRNRGFGNVRCELLNIEDTDVCKMNIIVEDKTDDEVILSYRLRNVSPLMLSAELEDASENYISGQSILGALSGAFKKKYGKDAPEEGDTKELFRNMFLDGTICYTNAYPCEGDRIYYPAPEYINRLKKSKEYVYVLQSALPDLEDLQDEYRWDQGNQPKKLKGKFVFHEAYKTENVRQIHVDVHEVEKDIIYHHSRAQKNSSGEEGLLYSLEAIRENQIFEGEIHIPANRPELVNEVKSLFSSGELYLGKSLSSQYGKCVLEKACPKEGRKKVQSFSSGEYVVVTFMSDAVFLNQRGEYTVYRDEVCELIANEIFCVDDEIVVDIGGNDQYASIIQTKNITGYLSIWNLRKPKVPGIHAGSCIVFHVKEGKSIKCPFQKFVGERNMEGYGQVQIESADASYQVVKLPPNTTEQYSNDEEKNVMLKDLMNDVLMQSWMEERKWEALKKSRSPISNTALGRITLMLRESIDEFPLPEQAEERLNSFWDRIESIKSKDTKKEVEKLVNGIAEKTGTGWKWEYGEYEQNDSQYPEIMEMKSLNIHEKDMKIQIRDTWSDYLLTILTQMKYRGME